MNIKEEYNCRLCGNKGNFIGLIEDKEFVLIKCPECGFIFREERIRRDNSINKPPIDNETSYRRLYSRFQEVNNYKALPGKILDIGCARGQFLDIARENGWDVWGVDIDGSGIEYCERRGIKAKQGEIIDVKLEKNSFDVVCMFHVLEHIININQTLSEVYGILKDGGLLVVEVPTIGSLKARIYGRYWSYIAPEHINYFTPQVLKDILEIRGFRILQAKFYSTAEFVDTVNKITHRSTGSRLKERLRFLLPLKYICEKIFYLPYLGDTLVLYAEKRRQQHKINY